MLYDALVAPFVEFAFMRRALVASLGLSLGAAPIGVLLVLRRMSLVGDAMSHAILPGAAFGFLLAGLSLGAMTLGGFVAGVTVALLAGAISRATPLREDASFAAFYLVSLALGVLVISVEGSNIDLMHVLFGSILAVDDFGLLLVAGVTTVTVLTLAAIYRPLLVECFDPDFLRSVAGEGGRYHMVFLILVVLNLVAAFQALGTLMAVGLMMLPAAAARFWADDVWRLAAIASFTAALSAVIGLLASYHADWPSGPSIVLAAGALYGVSLLVGARGGLLRTLIRHRHLEA
jgi:zinc/manganese transport system permease protein